MVKIFFDFETTGCYWNFDAPVQIAAICEKDGEIIDSFNELCRTTVTISPQATKVHGITREMIKDKRGEAVVLRDFVKWIRNHNCDMLIGYNSKAFDLPMLEIRCAKFGIPGVSDIKHMDGYYTCVKLAKDRNYYNLKTILGRKWNLGAVAEVLGFSKDGAHDALTDVKMLRNIWNKVEHDYPDLIS